MFISFQGIFISRVNKGGASEKAGIHVGDRLLEVGGEFFFYVCNFCLIIYYSLLKIVCEILLTEWKSHVQYFILTLTMSL